MAGGKTHGTGTRAKHDRKESIDRHKHKERQSKRRLNRLLRNRNKKGRKAVRTVKAVTEPEILKQWARKERLTARKEVKERKIRQFTFYCRLLAIDALYLKHMPKRAVRIEKNVIFRPSKKGILSTQQKKDILEKLNEMETNQFNRKEQFKKQVGKLKKRLPKTI